MLEACSQYWWLPLLLAALIGLITAWWIWGGKADAPSADLRIPDPHVDTISAAVPPVAVPAVSVPDITVPKVTIPDVTVPAVAAPDASLSVAPVAANVTAPVTSNIAAGIASVAAVGAVAAATKKPAAAKTAAKTGTAPTAKTVTPKVAAPKKVAVKPVALAATVKAEAKPAAAKAKAEPKPKAAPKAAAKAKASIPDNLELLKGVGPKLNGLLKSLGVTSFEQVANWTAADVRDVDSKLGSFAGRIGRDNWVDQAKLLVKGDIAGFEKKYGSLGSEIDRG